MTRAERWVLAGIVVLVALMVALWPRTGTDDAGGRTPGQGALGSLPASLQAEDDSELAPLRRRAALRPCPAPSAGAPDPSGPLAGVSAACLGAPGQVDVGAALAGRAMLLNLWASWCLPCREEMPVLAAYAERPGSIPVLGVNVKDRASAALAFMADVGIDYPSLYDGKDTVQRALGVPPVLPLNYLVRPDGSVERITDPPVFHSPEEIAAAVERHLHRDR